MTTEHGKSGAGEALRATVGVVLFAVWAVMTFLWFYDAIHALVHGEPGPAIKAVVWLLLMLLLAGMEGLEVAVIDRWSHLYPERPTSDLAGWLAARQLFVALIVTAATLLADRDSLAIPFVATPFTGSSGPQDLQPCLYNAHRAVVHADLPEAHGRDECGPLPESLSSGAVPGRRVRPRDRNLVAGREDRPGRSEPARLARRADPREGTIAARRVPGQSLGRSGPVARARDPV